MVGGLSVPGCIYSLYKMHVHVHVYVYMYMYMLC